MFSRTTRERGIVYVSGLFFGLIGFVLGAITYFPTHHVLEALELSSRGWMIFGGSLILAMSTLGSFIGIQAALGFFVNRKAKCPSSPIAYAISRVQELER